MKLPQILAETDVPLTPASSGYAAAAGAPLLAAAAGIDRVGRAVTSAAVSIADQRAQVDREKQRAEKAVRTLEAGIEAAERKSGAELRLEQVDSDLRAAVNDPDEYDRQWNAGLATTLGDMLKDVKHPETTAELRKAWPGIAQRHYAKMLTAKNAMRVDRLKSGLTRHLDELQQLGSREGFDDESEGRAGVHLANIRVAIDSQRLALGDKNAEDLWIGQRDAFLEARAKRHAEEDAAGFLGAADTSPLYQQMSPAKRTDYIAQAQRAAKQQRADAEKALDESVVTWKKSIRRETGTHLDNRTLTHEWLEEYKYAFEPNELTAYQKSLHAQTYGGPKGDPRVMDQFQIDVYDTSTRPGDGKPTASQVRDRLVFARKNDLVTNDKYTAWITHLDAEINRRTGEATGERKEGDARVREYQERNFRLTMENVDRVFRTTTLGEQLLGKFDPIVAQAAALFREEIQRRANYTGRGNEEADAVYRQRLPFYLSQVESNAEARLGQLDLDLRLKTASALKAAERTMPKEQWLEQVRIFNEIQAIRKELLLMKARAPNAGPSGTPAPETTPKPSGNPRARGGGISG